LFIIEVEEVSGLIFVGNDWAEDHHDIHVMNADGKKLAARRFPEGVAGVSDVPRVDRRARREP
jgi:hypothetical protein